MDYRYKIRIYETREKDGSLAAGAVVVPTDRSFSLTAASAGAVERILCEYVTGKKLPTGRIYQICPGIGNPEEILSVAIGEGAESKRVILEAAMGMYSVYRRIRYAETKVSEQEVVTEQEFALA